MSATKILWGQITVVVAIVLITLWAATQWTAWRLGYQPQLGQPWFELWRGVPAICLRLLGGGTLRRLCAAHFVEGPVSRHRADYLDRCRHRHVGVACARGEGRGHLWHGAPGDAAKCMRPDYWVPPVSCWVGRDYLRS
jgi:hypothetical protein